MFRLRLQPPLPALIAPRLSLLIPTVLDEEPEFVDCDRCGGDPKGAHGQGMGPLLVVEDEGEVGRRAEPIRSARNLHIVRFKTGFGNGWGFRSL